MPSQRTLKRLFLRSTALLPAASAEPPPSYAEGLAALDGVHSAPWALSAVLALLQRPDIEAREVDALVARVLRRTQAHEMQTLEQPARLELLQLRRRALRIARLARTHAALASSSLAAAASASSSSSSLHEFLALSAPQHAAQLAQHGDARGLVALLRALPAPALRDARASREGLVRLLLFARALQGEQLDAHVEALLPRLMEKGGVWEEQIAQEQQEDATDATDVTDELEVRRQLDEVYGPLDETPTLPPSADTSSHSAVTSSRVDGAHRLATYYVDLIHWLECSVGNAAAALQVARFASAQLSDATSSSAMQDLERLREDLALLSAAPTCTSLADFRLSLMPARRKATFLSYLRASPPATGALLELLSSLASRSEGGAFDAHVSLLSTLLTLLDEADEEALRILTLILPSLPLEEEETARVVLSATYSTQTTSGKSRVYLSALLKTSLETSTCSTAQVDPEHLAVLLETVPRASALYELLPSPASPLLSLAAAHLRTLKFCAARATLLAPSAIARAAADERTQAELCLRLLRAGEARNREWRTLAREVGEMTQEGATLELLGGKEAARMLLEECLKSADLQAFKSLLSDPHAGAQLSSEELEALVLRCSNELFASATSANLHRGEMRGAYDSLAVLPSSPALQAERAFIEGVSRLSSYNMSTRHGTSSSAQISPSQVRSSSDRLDLIARLLSLNDEAYRTPAQILELAHKLCAVPSPGKQVIEHSLIEARTLSFIAGAALAASDFAAARSACEQLVALASSLDARTADASLGAPAREEAGQRLAQVQEAAWQSSVQLARHPEWSEARAKADVMASVLALCPPARLAAFLKQWRELDALAAAAAAPATRRTRDRGTGASSTTARGSSTAAASYSHRASAVAAAAASAASPFSSLFSATLRRASPSSSSSSSSVLVGAGGATQPKPTAPAGGFGRAAQLFDRLGEYGAGAAEAQGLHSVYDPAERAARAARSFLGGLAGSGAAAAAREGEKDGATAAQTTFSLSRGVGWLMGEEERR